MGCCASSEPKAYTSATRQGELPRPVCSVTSHLDSEDEVSVEVPTRGQARVESENVPNTVSGSADARAQRPNPTVPQDRILSVIKYTAVYASADTAADGSVTAELDYVKASDHVDMIWSNGEKTRGCVLQGVRPGLYVGVVVSLNEKSVHCLHAASPIRVRVSTGNDLAT